MPANPAECVLEVLARKSGLDAKQISMESRLLHDLGIDGDDATEAIDEISRRCLMDISGFDPTQYFRSEPTLLTFLWFLPSQQRDRIDKKRPLTVGALVEAARSGSLRT